MPTLTTMVVAQPPARNASPSSTSGQSPLVEGNEIAFNNTAGHHTQNGGCYAAGGTKFVRSNHLIVRGNYVHDNDCAGLWTDIDNINTTYEDNRVGNNYAQGIFVEIRTKAPASRSTRHPTRTSTATSSQATASAPRTMALPCPLLIAETSSSSSKIAALETTASASRKIS